MKLEALLGTELPIIQAPMAGVQGSALAVATANAGALGFLPCAMLVRKVASAMRSATPLPVEALAAPRLVTGVDFSDHASYWEAGYDAVMVTDTAFFRNRHYHTMTDTPDRLDYVRMSQVVQGVRAAVLALAQ